MRSLPFFPLPIWIFLNTGLFVGFGVGIFGPSDNYNIDLKLYYRDRGSLLRHQFSQ
jgi:hypothetical protein